MFLSESHLSPVQDRYLIVATIASVNDRSVILTLDNPVDKELPHVGEELRDAAKEMVRQQTRGGLRRGRGGGPRSTNQAAAISAFHLIV